MPFFQGVNISKPFEAWLYDDYIKAIFQKRGEFVVKIGNGS